MKGGKKKSDARTLEREYRWRIFLLFPATRNRGKGEEEEKKRKRKKKKKEGTRMHDGSESGAVSQ